MPVQSSYDNLCSHTRETALISSVQAVLEWDERTKLPPAGGDYRAEQVTYLAGVIHQRQTAPKLGEWLDELSDSPLAVDPTSDTGAVIHCLARDYKKKTRLPQSLVEEIARTAMKGQRVWAEARQEDSFAKFQGLLEKMVDLKRQEAAAFGYDDSPYDPLLDDYEPGEKTRDVAAALAELRDQLVPLVEQIRVSGREPNVGILSRRYPEQAQEEFGKLAAATIGFEFDAGRLDVTDHPFCTGLGPRDTRLTTRYDEHAFSGGFFGILHEAGHGIYDQGLPQEHFGLPTGEAVSLGIHESQSRMWENLVGRSFPFWQYFYAQAQKAFPSALKDVPLEDFYFAINDVRPSLIRVEADEATYNLHILIRFELELALIAGQLEVADLPGAWNEKYRSYLGIDPPNDAQGVLQDVHWSAGLFGYFPTYALGNLYASQFFLQATRELGNLDEQFRKGDFEPLRQWLTENVYKHGRRFLPKQLGEQVTSHPLSPTALMRHLEAKYGRLYELDRSGIS